MKIRGLILAAGRGSRLKQLTEDRPKGLVPLRGHPLLEWQLHALRGAGIRQIAVVGGYRADALEKYGLTTFVNGRWAESNMVRSLMTAGSWLGESATIVSYSDIVYDTATVRRLAADPADIAISFDPDWLTLWSQRFTDPLSDAESFLTDDLGFVRDIGRKVATLDEIRGQYMGLLKFSPAGWQRIMQTLQALPPEKCDRLDMTSMLSLLISEGVKVKAVACAGPWAEIDSETDLSLYEGGSETAKLPPVPQ